MRPIIKDLTLSKEQIIAVLQDWLNTDVLCLCPHIITDICQYEADEGDGRFSLVLQPAPEPEQPELTTATTWLPIAVSTPVSVYPTTNGNGHHDGVIGGNAPAARIEDEYHLPDQPAPAAKSEEAPAVDGDNPAPAKRGRITDEQYERIIALAQSGAKRSTIANSVGLGESTVYRIIAEARASGLIRERVDHHAATQ